MWAAPPAPCTSLKGQCQQVHPRGALLSVCQCRLVASLRGQHAQTSQNLGTVYTICSTPVGHTGRHRLVYSRYDLHNVFGTPHRPVWSWCCPEIVHRSYTGCQIMRRRSNRRYNLPVCHVHRLLKQQHRVRHSASSTLIYNTAVTPPAVNNAASCCPWVQAQFAVLAPPKACTGGTH
jgi:hypothetical protein